MRSIFITLFTVALATIIPSLTFGGMGYSTPKPSSTSGVAPSTGATTAGYEGILHRETPVPSATPQTAVAQVPYNLGAAIYTGTYHFKKATVTHSAEKAHRLAILQTGLPAAEQKKINPKELANHLSDREMNALEYFIRVRFEKFVTVSPSWAKEEPPIKVNYTK